MKNFLLYIVFIFSLFNISFANAIDAEKLLFDASHNRQNTYEIRNFAKNEEKINKRTPLLKTNNDFFLLFAMPSIIDKLYKGDLIHKDITPFVEAVYPDASPSAISFMADAFKQIVKYKRIYREVIAKLKYRIKAHKIVPKDADIIAKKGEYAETEADYNATFKKDEYTINYEPYKYIEYDLGEYGEPVRLMDKNYIKTPDTDELNLALLRFDIRGIYNAIKKIKTFVDYSAENFVETSDGLKARIIFDHVNPGKLDNINGVIDVHIPKDHYINGDFLNKTVKPYFVFNENSDYDLNISDFNLYHPLAVGIIKDGVNKRIFTDVVRFPFSIKRQNYKKSLYFEGNFYFELCNKDGDCKKTSTKHFIRLKPSMDEKISLYNNYITQSHTHLPPKTSKNVQILDVNIDKINKKVSVYFKTKKQINNISAMVEDEYGTNFTNPNYQIINDNIALAQFDIISDNIEIFDDNYELAISGAFNDREVLRDIVSPSIDTQTSTPIINDINYSISPLFLFLFGILIAFNPGIFYITTSIINILKERDDYFIIFFRYLLSSIIGFLLYFSLISHISWHNLYFNPLVFTLGIIIVSSQIYFAKSNFNLMLFRPFNSIFKLGSYSGFCVLILMMSFPVYYSDKVLTIFNYNTFLYKTLASLVIWLGFVFPVFIFGILLKNFRFVNFNVVNIVYNLLYVVVVGWIIFYYYGAFAVVLVIGMATLIIKFWSIYTVLMLNKLGNVRKKSLKKELFFTFEKKSLLLIFVIYIFSAGIISFMPQKQTINVSHDIINNTINKNIDNDKRVLVIVDSKSSLRHLYNLKKINSLSNINTDIFDITYKKEDIESTYWLNRFNKKNLPLYIIFTRRYPNGLILPDNLIKIDWSIVSKYYEYQQF